MHITVSRDEPDTRVLTVAGEIDMATVPHVHSAVDDALRDEAVRRLVLDFADVTFLDCTGIAALLQVTRQARARGACACLVRCRPVVLRVLDATGVTGHLLG